MRTFILSGIISVFFLWSFDCSSQSTDNNNKLNPDQTNKEIKINSGKKMPKPEYAVIVTDNHIKVIISQAGKKITSVEPGEAIAEEKQKGGNNEK